ncbi:MAG: DUF58 domain-containing protein, partial [Chloroflexi bacterium]|nr:DUF58 domain-containing protein [Chloroflexota bacterium]
MRGQAWWAALCVLFMLSVWTRTGLLTVFVLILAVAGGASALWERYGLSGVSYTRRVTSPRLAFHEETILELTITNAKPLPLAWLLVRDSFPDGLALLGGKVLRRGAGREGWLITSVSLRWYERVTRRHRLRGERRGIYRLGPAELVTGDIFGMRRRERTDETVQRVIVYPPIVDLGALGLPPSRPLGEWLASLPLLEDPLRFAAVRDYVPGDQPRHIHWKSTARTGS